MRTNDTNENKYLVGLLAGSELQVRAVLVVGQLRYRDLAPEIGCKEGVSFCDLR